ncbi:MAG TPA: phosphatase PAP2 family protein [Bacteroidia bacterium]|nr:phosphatase PAP2 family protein [Bacteroidia bacterium]
MKPKLWAYENSIRKLVGILRIRMISYKWIVAIVILLCVNNSYSQSHRDSVSYLKSYYTDTRDLIIEPLHWNKNDLANFTLVAGATGFLMIYDEKIDEFVQRNQNENLLNFSQNVLSPFGNGLYSIPALGIIYVSGVISKNPFDKEMALLGLKAFTISAGAATVSKYAFQRHRPIDDNPPDAFAYDGPFGGFSNEGSFVSRHATTAFAVATVISEGYKSKKRWVPYVAYSLASLVACSRVYEREHWASDVFAGAALGFVTGKFLYYINYGYKTKKIKYHQNF